MCDNEEVTTLVHDTVAHDEETRTVPNESSSAPATSNDDVTNAEDSDFEGETFTISSTLFERLRDMGFSENAIKKSIASGCINEDTCTQWITMHLGHAELDTPLDATAVRVIVKVQRILTEEEKAARAAELKELIKAKKASEAVTSAQQERENEKKRIEMGKLMHEAKELREAAQRQNAAEERRREKEADIKAREKAQVAILVDRYVRGGKTPEEAARIVAEEFEERKKRQREEAAEKLKTLSTPEVASAPTSEWNLGAVLGVNPSSSNNVANHTASVFAEPLVPPPTAETFSSLVAAIIAESQPATSSISTLRMILTNISEAPLESKKRTLRVTSNVFRNNIAPFPSAVRFLRVLNFELTNDAEGQEFVSQHSVVLRWLYRALEALPKQ